MTGLQRRVEAGLQRAERRWRTRGHNGHFARSLFAAGTAAVLIVGAALGIGGFLAGERLLQKLARRWAA